MTSRSAATRRLIREAINVALVVREESDLLIKQVGADKLKGMFFTSPEPVPGSSALNKFEKNYTAAYKTTKDKPYIANTYDAVMLVALAIEQASSTDRTKVRDGSTRGPSSASTAATSSSSSSNVHSIGLVCEITPSRLSST